MTGFAIRPAAAPQGFLPRKQKRSRPSRVGPVLTAVVLGLGIAALKLGFVWYLAMVGSLAFAAAIIGVRHPGLGLMGVSLLCTLDTVMRAFLFDAVDALLPFNTFNYWLLIAIALNAGLIRRFRDTQTKLFLAFIALLTIELVFSERISRGAQHILGISTMFGILVYFVRAAGNDGAWYWQGIVSAVAAMMGGLLYNLQRSEEIKLNPNVLSMMQQTGIFAICLAFGFASSNRKEVALMALAAINVILVFLSSSRGGLLIASVGLFFLVWSMRGMVKRSVYVGSALVAAVLISGVFSDLQAESVRRLEKLWSADESIDGRTSGRSSLARGGVQIFLDNLMGVGTGGSELAWSQLDYVEGVSDLKAGEEYSLHSGWIKVLAENGVPGIVLFAAVVLSFAVRGWLRRERFMRGMGIAVSLTLAVAFLSTEFQGKGLWFLAAGALTLLNREQMLAAMAGGKRRSVWWARPAVTSETMRPRALGWDDSPADARQPALRPVAPPRPRV
jgi:hypothetical protein